MAAIVERNECEVCHRPEGMCLCCATGSISPGTAVHVVRRYTDERYLLELLKAAKALLDVLDKHEIVGLLPMGTDAGAVDALQAAVVWIESDGLGPVSLSGQGQLELGGG